MLVVVFVTAFFNEDRVSFPGQAADRVFPPQEQERLAAQARQLATIVSFTSVLAHDEVATVVISPSGFTPQEITLHQGSKITFVNKDNAPHWPASDFHPIHDRYIEFDPKKAIAAGDVWGFRAGRIGEWSYHDHLSPHKKGKLVVVSQNSRENMPKNFWAEIKDFFHNLWPAIIEKWGNYLSKNKGPSLNRGPIEKLSATEQYHYLSQLSKEKGVASVWSYLVATFQGETGAMGRVHDLAHFTGGLIYDHSGWDGLSLCTPKFAFGCYHGFLDKAFQKDLSGLARAQAGCLRLGAPSSGPFASCMHGVGHGIASFYKTTDLTASLASCDFLSSGQEYCSDGVFMEFERDATAEFYKASDPLYPCNALNSKSKVYSCSRNLPNVLLGRFKKTLAQVAAICQAADDLEITRGCVDAVGFVVASQSGANAQAILAGCRVFVDENHQKECLTKAAGELIFQEVPGWEQTAPVLCRVLERPEDCLSYLQKIIVDYGRKAGSLLRDKNAAESEEEYLRTQMRLCWETGNDNDCYQKLAALLSRQFTLAQNLALLSATQKYPEVYARCHEVTHYLSREEFERVGSIAEVYSSCDSTCHGGCYHGVLEAYLKKKTDKQGSIDFATTVPSICGQPGNYAKPLIYYECIHGMGHAAMFVTAMELPTSLAICDAFDTVGNRERCYGGVFMENSSSSTNTTHHGKYVKTSDPYYPCNAVEKKYQKLCWRYQSSYFTILTKYDWPRVVELCFGVSREFHDECFRTVGTNQVGFSPDGKVWRANCELIADRALVGVCVSGVISSLSYRFVNDPSRMIAFCQLVSVPHQQSCFTQIGLSVVEWFAQKEEASGVCQKIGQDRFRQFCQEGVRSYRYT